jgi:hypothetical protein
MNSNHQHAIEHKAGPNTAGIDPATNSLSRHQFGQVYDDEDRHLSQSVSW